MRLNLSRIPQSSANISVQAHWDPIADSFSNLPNESPRHAELCNLSPSHPVKEYGTEAFKVFIPASAVAVGDVWDLDSEGVVPFLRQFHPGATTTLTNGEEGAFACLRAISSDYAEIVFRIHAEIRLAGLAEFDWEWQGERIQDDWMDAARFLLSQFAGRLLLNLKKGSVRAFSLALPSRNSNVDFNSFERPDMVFVPRMELVAEDADDQSEFAWEEAITVEEARKKLELRFYRFAEIDWLPIDEAVVQAETTHRPIHAILVWGALDDESC